MNELPGRPGHTGGMLPEVPEAQASGSVQEIYAEIRRLCGVPMVALIYRHLATIPGALEWAWALLRPAMTAGLVQEKAWQLAARSRASLNVSLPRPALRVAGISAEDETCIGNILDAYNRANPINLLAMQYLAHHLGGGVGAVAGVPATASTPAAAQPAHAWEAPQALAALPAMIDPQDMAPQVRELVSMLAHRGGASTSTVLPTLYRHLARFPAMLGFAASIVTPQFPVIDAAAVRLRRDASLAARALSGRAGGHRDIAPPVGEHLAQLQSALDDFTQRIIPEMVVIGELLRRALPAEATAGPARTPAVATSPAPLNAEEAISTRRSVRAFLPTPVQRETVQELLALASRSASGSNIQPWKVHVVGGEVRARLSRTILDAIERDGYEPYRREWNYYPVNWREPYLGRRRKIGWGLYGLLGIGKGDFEATERQRRRNYEFFGAPVGMIFTLDEDLEIGSWLDLGIYIGSLTIAARGRGLDTCAQAAFAEFHTLIRPILGLPEREIIICGLALGVADPNAIENRLVTERASPEEFATFSGFGQAPASRKDTSREETQ